MSCCSKLCLSHKFFWPNFLLAERYSIFQNSASTMSSKVTWAVFPLLSGSPGNRIYPVRPGPPHPLFLLLLPHLPLHLIQLLLALLLLLHLLLLPLFLLLLLLQLHLLLPLQRQDSTLKQRYSVNRAHIILFSIPFIIIVIIIIMLTWFMTIPTMFKSQQTAKQGFRAASQNRIFGKHEGKIHLYSFFSRKRKTISFTKLPSVYFRHISKPRKLGNSV